MPKADKGEKAATKKAKKEKDPNAPKKPIGAYMWFCKAKRGEVKEEHPDWSVTEIGRRLGELWKELTDEEKVVYQDEAEQDKLRYQNEMKEYHPAEA